MPQIHEQTTLAEAAVAGSAQSGRMTIQVITPGQGTSGYYSAAVCEAAAPLVAAGTPMYLDHPTESDEFERPERSLRDLAAVFEGPGRWDPDRQAVVADAQVFSPYREVLTEMAPYIGVSVRGDGERSESLVNGVRRRVVESIKSIASVDFVTAAGRGGRVLEILESARVSEAANVGQQLESRIHQHFTNMADNMAATGGLTREERMALSGAIGDALQSFNDRVAKDVPHLYQRQPGSDAPSVPMSVQEALLRVLAEASANDTQQALSDVVEETYGSGDNVYSWVRDYDPEGHIVYFDVRSPGNAGTYSQSYELGSDGSASLTGARAEVNVRTTYVPVSPAGSSTTQESEEDTMPNIEEARLRELEEAAGRVQTLESERDTAVTERDTARRELAESTARTTAATRARTRIAEGNNTLAAAVVDRIVENATRTVPLTEAGALDETAFDTQVDAARTAEETYLTGLAEAAGAGSVHGLGGTPVPAGDDEQKLREANDQQRAGIFGRKTIKEA